MKSKIWIAGIWGEANLNTVSGLEQEPDVTILKDDFAKHEQLQKIYQFIQRRLRGHGKRLLYCLLETPLLDRYYQLSGCDFAGNEQNYIVIFNSAIFQYYSAGYFKRLKKKYKNIKLILYIIDPMPNGMLPRIDGMRQVFDKILTVHRYNAKRYHIEFFKHIYTPVPPAYPADRKRDLYY